MLKCLKFKFKIKCLLLILISRVIVMTKVTGHQQLNEGVNIA